MIDWMVDIFHALTDPEQLVQWLITILSGWWAYVGVFLIVFAETGLLIGFFLPGDSLLFTFGVISGAGQLNFWWLMAVLIPAAIIGDSVGYYLGHKAGPVIFRKPRRFIKQEHLLKTKAFYDRHGGKTIIYARFIPIIRTFAPFVAGVAQMDYRQFLSYNIFGGVFWVLSMCGIGYFLGNVPFVQANFEKVILAIILISFLPAIIEFIRHRRQH